MRRWMAAALALALFAGCSAKEAPTTNPHAQQRHAHEALEALDADTKR